MVQDLSAHPGPVGAALAAAERVLSRREGAGIVLAEAFSQLVGAIVLIKLLGRPSSMERRADERRCLSSDMTDQGRT